jgi:hypothetical protein
MKRYQLIYKIDGYLPITGKTIYRSLKCAMKHVNWNVKDGNSVCLCTYEKCQSGYILIESKEF